MSHRIMSRYCLAAATVALAFATFSFAAGGDARLVQAVKAGDKATVSTLLQQKVDVNVPEADGTTALHWAVRADDAELVERLLRSGANAKTANRYGITPLYLASVNGNAPIIEKLL